MNAYKGGIPMDIHWEISKTMQSRKWQKWMSIVVGKPCGARQACSLTSWFLGEAKKERK